MLRAFRALVRRSLERPDPRHRVDLLLRQLLEPREHRLQHRGVLRLVRQVRRLASIHFQVVEDRAALELRVGAFRRWRGVQRAGGIRAVNPKCPSTLRFRRKTSQLLLVSQFISVQAAFNDPQRHQHQRHKHQGPCKNY